MLDDYFHSLFLYPQSLALYNVNSLIIQSKANFVSTALNQAKILRGPQETIAYFLSFNLNIYVVSHCKLLVGLGPFVSLGDWEFLASKIADFNELFWTSEIDIIWKFWTNFMSFRTFCEF
jgi:hypothetical protein